MSAVVKYIAIHETSRSGVKSCLDYIKDAEKTEISKAVGYIGNKEKTTIIEEKTVLVSPANCASTLTADLEFQWCKDRYRNKKDENLSEKIIQDENNPRSKGTRKRLIDAVHIIQSFSNDVNDPVEVHDMGKELVARLYPEHAAVIATHVNKENISGESQYHNHILVCSYNQEGNRKIQYNQKEINRARKISDQICIEHGQSILKSKGKALPYGEWKAKNIDNNSWKDELCSAIDIVKRDTDNWMSYKVNMRMRGYDINENHKSVTYIVPDYNRKIRDSALGEIYTKTALKRFWSSDEKEIVETSLNRLDDSIAWNIINLSNVKQPKIDKGKYTIWVSYYDAFGRERSIIEILLLIWLKTILMIFIIFKNMLKQRAELYEKIVQEYKKALDTIEKLRLHEISSKEELKKKMNEIGSEISHLKKQIKEMKEKTITESSYEDDLDRTERVALLIELERLQGLLKDKNMVYTDLSKIKRVIEKAENQGFLFELLKKAQVTVDKSDFQTKTVDKVTDMPEDEQDFESLIEMEIREKNLEETEL